MEEALLTSSAGGFEEAYEQTPIKPRIVFGGEHSLKEPKVAIQDE